jgi:hypothetical protein
MTNTCLKSKLNSKSVTSSLLKVLRTLHIVLESLCWLESLDRSEPLELLELWLFVALSLQPLLRLEEEFFLDTDLGVGSVEMLLNISITRPSELKVPIAMSP